MTAQTAAEAKLFDRPTNVLMVTHYYGDHGGGIERVADRLARDITLVSTLTLTWAASACDTPPDAPGLTPLPMAGTNFIEKAIGLPWPLWSWKSLARLKAGVKAADVVWLHDTLYPGNRKAFHYAQRFGKPIVITQHIGPVPYKNPLMRWAMRWADKILTSKMLLAADEVIFISDRVAEDYYSRVPFTRAIKVISNGVDSRVFHTPLPENRRYLRRQFALKADQPVLLFVGRFVERKGLPVIQHLASLLPGWRFWLAGNGPIDPAKWLLPNVHVFRDRSDRTLSELYQAADMLILPSYGEGYPLVVQEALASGLPVLVGPDTAAGNRTAQPYLRTAEVFPKDPLRTAKIWARALAEFPAPLPLETPDETTANFAQSAWDWAPIANAYAEILTACRRK